MAAAGGSAASDPGRGEDARFTHVDERGAARMVDVSGKDVSVRTAIATGRVRVSPAVVELLRGEGLPKGDVLAVARIAGIQAAKRTPDLVPLCHPIAIHGVTVDFAVAHDAIEITATVPTAPPAGVVGRAFVCAPTPRSDVARGAPPPPAPGPGVEMEALTCVAVAGLT